MAPLQRRDGFVGEKQINVPEYVLEQYAGNMPFSSSLYITHIGFFPKAQFHFREREQGCDDFILIYCLEGKGLYSTSVGNYELTANQFFILPPHQFHNYQADLNDPWTIYWVHFSSSKLKDLGQEYDLEKFVQPTNILFNQKILDTWNEMYVSLAQEYTRESVGYANFCLYHFIAYFIFPANTKNLLKEMQSEDPLARSIAFMKNNIHKQLSVEEIATQFHYSPSHYTALFKKKTGLSPIDYFIRMKIHYACQLLTQRELIIKEIADKIGYEDPYYFSRIFKKVTGKSPAQYKSTV
ncbi:MAG TPA: AraC family transcriptional regulator [Chitinophagaceae bacterium]|nr:AraC family transcriptional regulator [Chitinophagaceae bacterium]